jgi:enoyl-CoA hydratase/carnithine racemase
MATLERVGRILVLDLGSDENRLRLSALDELEAALDEAGATEGPAALVTTAEGKIFSNGLELELLLAPDGSGVAYVARVERLLARLLCLPLPTVAAVGGHAFAGGAMLALCHDLRVMRADRGYFCLPEVDLGLPFTPGMSALLAAKLPIPARHEAMVLGRRYGGLAALEAGIVQHAEEQVAVLPRALELADELAPKAGAAMGAIKRRLYAQVVDRLGEPAGT